MKKQVLITSLGIGVLFTPIPYQAKTIAAWLVAVPNLLIASRIYSRAKVEVKTAEGRLEALESQIIKLEGQLTEKANEISAIEQKARQRINQKESQVASKLLKVEADLKAAQSIHEQALEEKAELIDKVQAESDEMLSKIAAREEATLKILEEQERELASKRELALQEVEQFRQQVNLEAEFLKKQVQLEADAIASEIHVEQQTWRTELEQQMEVAKAEIQEEYYEECDASISARIQKIEQNAADMVRQKLKAAFGEIEKLQEEKKTLSDRLKLLHEKLQATRQVKKPTEIDMFSTIARNLIEFYERQGVQLDFVSVRPVADGSTIVCVNPWRKDAGIEKELEKFFNALMVEFKLLQPPTHNITPVGYDIHLHPQPYHYGGLPPVNPYSAQAHKFGSSVYEEDEPDLEELATEALGNNEARKLMQERLEDDHVKFMLSFHPPANKVKPTSLALETVEVQWVEWLYKWRTQATGQPNITTQNDLLLEIYGVSPGRGTDEESLLGESLRDRLHRIMDLLELPRRKRKVDE
ncbi:MAG: hypothetical protein F6J92_03450 [Symploca sp. SIO1A3]|nr:hypothetical protein [Symploca sp. SIO1A3]